MVGLKVENMFLGGSAKGAVPLHVVSAVDWKKGLVKLPAGHRTAALKQPL
jgi:GTP-dependent phosphoenolpyruvate carboxykinase